MSEDHAIEHDRSKDAPVSTPPAAPVASQWRCVENGEPRTSWQDIALGDLDGWKRYAASNIGVNVTIEYRDLYASPVAALDMSEIEVKATTPLRAASAICRSAANDMIQANLQWRLDPRYILRLCDAVDAALSAAPEPAGDSRDALIERLRGLIRWAHDTLYEINPSNYDHDEVCKLNDASVEVILGLAVELGEKHGKTDEWWAKRISSTKATTP